MKITFKAKSYINALGQETIKTPTKFPRINWSDVSGRWDDFVNSNMMQQLITRRIESLKLRYIHPAEIYENVSIKDGFLKTVTIDLGEL